MMEETLEKSSTSSLAAPFIFLLAIVLQLLSLYLERLKKGGMKNAQQTQLRLEIKKLLKEASALSSPSTFAQAALLRREAAAKEKELLKIQESYNKETKGSFDLYFKALWSLQVVTYLAMTIWFWGVPIAIIPQQLLQPFGKALSWRAGESTPGYVKVGVVPWLVLTARVSKFLCQKLPVAVWSCLVHL